jgi:hypothetical protein
VPGKIQQKRTDFARAKSIGRIGAEKVKYFIARSERLAVVATFRNLMLRM